MKNQIYKINMFSFVKKRIYIYTIRYSEVLFQSRLHTIKSFFFFFPIFFLNHSIRTTVCRFYQSKGQVVSQSHLSRGRITSVDLNLISINYLIASLIFAVEYSTANVSCVWAAQLADFPVIEASSI